MFLVTTSEDLACSGEEFLLPAASPCWSYLKRGGRPAIVAAIAASLMCLGAMAFCSGHSDRERHDALDESLLQVKAASLRATGKAQASQPAENQTEARKRPHIIFVLIDDLGFNDFKDSKDLGNSWPTVKALANESIFINTTYTESWCSPSRAALLTGRYYHLLSSHDFSSKDETTIAQRLNGEGYVSYAIGKWHVGWEAWAKTPIGRGFRRYMGNLLNPVDHYTHCSSAHLSSVSDLFFDQTYMESHPFASESSSPSEPHWEAAEGAIGKYDTEVYDQVARTFLLQHKDKFPEKPFFLYYAMYADHHPYQADAVWKEGCGEVVSEGRRNLCGMQYAADSALFNLTQLLKTHYADDDYVMILTGDNGGMIGRGQGVQGWSNNAPLRGAKFADWEGSVHSRAMVWGKHPDLQASSMLGKMYTGGFMHLVDWHATMAELGGASLDTGRFPASGTSVWKAVLSNGKSPRQEIGVKSGYDRMAYFRAGDWVILTANGDFDKQVEGSEPPVFPVPSHDYNDTVPDFLEYKANHPASRAMLPVLYNIWDDISMNAPVNNSDKLREMLQAVEQWFGEGSKSNASDTDCPSAACKEEREAAMDNLTRLAAKELEGKGDCAQRAFYPYWDAPTCSCS